MSQKNVPLERRKTEGEDNAYDLVVRVNLSWVDGADMHLRILPREAVVHLRILPREAVVHLRILPREAVVASLVRSSVAKTPQILTSNTG